MRTIHFTLLGLVVWLSVAGSAWGQPQAATEVEPQAQTQAQDRTPTPGIEVDLSSPRATMFTFLRAMNEINLGRNEQAAWQAVDATLAAPMGMDEAALREAAVALLDVLDKLGEVKELGLPDAGDVADSGVRRFVYFPQGEEHQWVWEELAPHHRWPGDRRIVLAASGEDSAWRFTPETVADAVELSDVMAPLPPRYIAATEEDQALTILGPTFERTRWWGWLALLGAIFVGLAVGKLVAALLRGAAGRLRDRGWPLRAVVFESFASPVSLALLTLGLAIGLRVFIYLEEEVAKFTFKVMEFLFLVAAGWVLYNLVDVVEMAIHRVTSKTHNKLDDMVVPLIRKSLRVFIVVVFFLVVAQNVFGLNITGWLAGLGIAGLAVSLAAQDSVKNLFGSLTVFFDKPFVVGDFITYGSYSGTVEEIGFRSTRLRLLSGHLVTIPNMKWIDNDVENVAVRPHIRREVNLRLAMGTPPDRIEQAVQIVREVLTDPEVVESGRFDMQNQPPHVGFDSFNPDSLNIKAFYWYRMAGDPDRGWFTWFHHCQLVNLKLFRRFAEAGIDFAFPTQTIHLANGDQPRPAPSEENRPG